MAFKLVVTHHADNKILSKVLSVVDGVGYTLYDDGSNPSFAPIISHDKIHINFRCRVCENTTPRY